MYIMHAILSQPRSQLASDTLEKPTSTCPDPAVLISGTVSINFTPVLWIRISAFIPIGRIWLRIQDGRMSHKSEEV
jgi:hypothetical protein